MQTSAESVAIAVRSNDTNRTLPDDPSWYRDAVIYQVQVRGFFDTNDDGVGDLPGLTQKLDYIQSLGVSAIWVQPFYPSPLRDDGYDIANYEDVHPNYGTRRDFLAFLNAAHARGLRVITELVINHTSDQHPWFQAARRAPKGLPKRNYYVWSDTDQKYLGIPIIFKDTEPSNWTWDPVAGQYFWHRFFHHQPDLNFDNPRVRSAVLRVMRFWLDMGVDGMRLDAVPYLVEREGTQCANLPETHAVLKEIRRELDQRYKNRMLLAEANQWPSDVRAYFGDGDECHMAFHFPLMPRLYMALRQEDRHPLSEILYQMPEIPDACQWAIFLRNHDELTLEMVSEDERDYMYQTYAADPQMRINAGIRRRLAPLMENSRPRIELMTALLLSLPGTPVLYYGDELGMGDNVYLGDRNAVRTPMQWNADRNGGFSRADPARLYAPLIMDSVYGYGAVNVEAQERSPHSLLAWMRRTISLRQQNVATFGRGTMELLRPANRRVFAFIRRIESEDPVLVVANLSRTVQAVSLDLARLSGLIPVEMYGGVELPRISEAPYVLTLGPYSFYWLKLQREPPSGGRLATLSLELEPEQSPLLVGPEWWKLLDGSVRQALERRYLPGFLQRQPWFERRRSPLSRVAITDWGTLRSGDEPVFVIALTATFNDGADARYLFPLAATQGDVAAEILRDTPEAAVVGLAGARKGLLHTRLDGAVGRILADAALAGRTIPLRFGTLQPSRVEGFERLGFPQRVGELPPAPLDQVRFHSHASFGERVMLKVARRLWPGPSPELEIQSFLTSRAGFQKVPVPGAILEYEDTSGARSTVALVNSYLPNQTAAWLNARDDVKRFFDLALTLDPPAEPPARLDTYWSGAAPPAILEVLGTLARTAAAVGQRMGELHNALGSREAVETFGAGRWDADYGQRSLQQAISTWERARAGLFSAAPAADTATSAMQRLLNRHDHIVAVLRETQQDLAGDHALIRIHGSLDLSHTLLYEGDPSFIGPADDSALPIDARRALESPLKDVATMIWSLQSAAALELAVRLANAPHDRERLTAWTRWWVAGAAGSLLAGYRRAAAGAAFVPADDRAATALLRLFLLERAFADLDRSGGVSPRWLEAIVNATLDLVES